MLSETKKQAQIVALAHAMHEAARAWSQLQGNATIPSLMGPWDQLTHERRRELINQVEGYLASGLSVDRDDSPLQAFERAFVQAARWLYEAPAPTLVHA